MSIDHDSEGKDTCLSLGRWKIERISQIQKLHEAFHNWKVLRRMKVVFVFMVGEEPIKPMDDDWWWF